jgi:4-amino-4-deoxy-L-arabinose transferase-like glycosyltransferase
MAKNEDSLTKRNGSLSFCSIPGHSNPYLLISILVLLSLILLWSGLSDRTLWGPEGRSAIIVKEMIQSGNYFLPTINGSIYFDKPLLGYWTALPFVRMGGLNEAMLRLPSTIAGLGTILVIFFIGRRLFDRRTGIFAALFLATSPMFLVWARTASADMMNTFVVWIMLWVCLLAREGRGRYLFMFYMIGAIGSFFKGPVAPAVSIFTVFLYSTCSVLVTRNDHTSIRKTFSNEFFWIASVPAVWSIVASLILFGVLFMAPIMLTGSWLPASMMWKENMVRFLGQHDHHNPPYTYIAPLLLFCAPWTFFTIASLWQARHWESGTARRWSILSAMGILLFFLVAGSRRSYYILPIIPALGLITGKVMADWTREHKDPKLRFINFAAMLTLALVVACAATVPYAYFFIKLYRDASSLLIGVFILAGAVMALHFLIKKERLKVLAVFFIVIFMIDIWGFTRGMKLAERGKTLREFAYRAKTEIDTTGEDNTALFYGGSPALIFYLNTKSHMTDVGSVNSVDNFRRKHPNGLLLVNLAEVPETMKNYFQGLSPVVVQQTRPNDDRERFVLVHLGKRMQISTPLTGMPLLSVHSGLPGKGG